MDKQDKTTHENEHFTYAMHLNRTNIEFNRIATGIGTKSHYK